MNIDQLKNEKIGQLKTDINELLNKTDWAIIRKTERGIEIPDNIALERQSLLEKCDSIESEINALATAEEVENYIISL